MAHVDGADQESGITPLISRIQEVSIGYPNGRLELHLVGGYMDPRGYSERLVNGLLREYLTTVTAIDDSHVWTRPVRVFHYPLLES